MNIRILLLLIGAMLSLAFGPFASARDDDDEGGSVGDLMERVHKGRRSPMRQTEQQLAQPQPQWPIVEQQLLGFARMCEALKKSRKADVRDAADGYVDAVKELAKSTQTRNLAAARKAMENLKNACGDCHYKGGPGGKLDDD